MTPIPMWARPGLIGVGSSGWDGSVIYFCNICRRLGYDDKGTIICRRLGSDDKATIERHILLDHPQGV